MGEHKGFIGGDAPIGPHPTQERLQPLGDILRRTFGGQEHQGPWASFRADLVSDLMNIDY